MDETTGKFVVFSTCETAEDAARIGRALVEERLAACVNVIPGIRSIYRWKDKVEEAGEVFLIIKTTEERFAALRDRIVELHPYEVPAIVGIPIAAGSKPYLDWVYQNCGEGTWSEEK